MPTLQARKRAYWKKYYRETTNRKHVKPDSKAKNNEAYYAQNAQKLKDKAKARYQDNPNWKKASSKAQYQANWDL